VKITSYRGRALVPASYRTLVPLAIVAIVLISSCTSSKQGSGTPGGSTTSSSSTAAKTTSPATSSSPATVLPPSTSTVQTTAAPPASVTTTAVADTRCHSNELALQAGQGQGAAGTLYQAMIFVVTGTRSCDIFGYPGVSFLNSSNAQIAAPANRRQTTGAPSTVHLNPGGKASFLVSNTNAGFVDSCNANPNSAFILVYPPDETVALKLAFVSTVCNPLTGFVQAGTDPSA
jgi:hypothetical protein